ncbi:MAG TPA: DUF1579 family protein [Ignavibacteria bacterium]|nr:DUF1579 family protein [Ignavibacteria bacterium]
MSKLEESKKNGIHSKLLKMTGNWKGSYKLWLEPDADAMESEVSGTIKPIMKDMFILHEYENKIEDQDVYGMAIYGCFLKHNELQSAWVDTFHNGTSIMYSKAKNKNDEYDVLGHYTGADENDLWGWRTTIEMPDDNSLLITMYNVFPEMDGNPSFEAKAVEFNYKRV